MIKIAYTKLYHVCHINYKTHNAYCQCKILKFIKKFTLKINNINLTKNVVIIRFCNYNINVNGTYIYRG